MANRTPSLQEVMGAHFDYQSGGMHTALPGIVVSVGNLAEQRIDVQPTLNMRDYSGETIEERPPILNVPLHMPVTKEGGLTYPISVGTPVFLIFSMRGMDVWKRGNGYSVTPSDYRKFDIKDCVAIPGIFPFSEATNSPAKRVNGHSVDDVVLVHNIGQGNEVEIRLKPNGDVIVNSPTMVQVNCKNAEVNAEVDITAIAGESAIVTANGDSVVNSQGNVSVTNAGWSQLVSSGSILIKSEERVKIQGPSGSLII